MPSPVSTNKKTSRNRYKVSEKLFKLKSKRKRNNFEDAVLSQDQSKVALQHKGDDVPDFPRGGGRILSRHDLEEVRAKEDAESEAEERFLKKNKRQKGTQKRSQTAEDEFGSLFGDAFMGNLPKLAKKITLKVGLCHVSKLSDEHVDNYETEYKSGERVTAEVLKVDEERNRNSLGIKNSYVDSEADVQGIPEIGSDNAMDEDCDFGAKETILPVTGALFMKAENGKHPILAELESRASIPPLDVAIDDDIANMDNFVHQDLECSIDPVIDDGTSKKRAKEEREKEIRTAEERLLEEDIPRNADEFEKLVRGSPDSSFAWIKYMGFMLSLADVEKARSIAERALRTINIREESEKLNIWVAYFNLENKYGNPPEEAVMKLFYRALQSSDAEKVHLALLGMYERTEQHKLANELLEKMVKKFKHSGEVWLRRIQILLKQNCDGMKLVENQVPACLPKRKRIELSKRAAILEFKFGVPDRGRSSFEKMLHEHPNKMDLWSTYLDQEIRLGEEDVIRALFERAIKSPGLGAKKNMKFMFKKYLEYEKSVGDEERIESVKRKAIEYVERSLE